MSDALPRLRRVALTLLVLGVVAALAVTLYFASVAVRVGTGFAAKVACSLHFNSGQDPDTLMRDYIDAELGGAGRLIELGVSDHRIEAVGPFGIRAVAIHRQGHGCTLLAGLHESEIAGATALPEPPPSSLTSRFGEDEKRSSKAIEAAIDEAFREPPDAEPGRVRATKAVVVIHDGRLVAERYAENYGRDTPMLSWSMAKSVLAALVGVAVRDGRLALKEPAPVPEWSAPGDPRGAITLDMLLRQSSGLAFDETYGAINDVSRMLFTRPDTGAYAAAQPLIHAPDTYWSYSSGTSNIIARLLAERFGRDPDRVSAYARDALFGPCELRRAFFEFDASGTPIGSSFVFMTALDWARFGELHRQDGLCAGQRVLPEGWVEYVTTPTRAAPQGRYGAHWWLNVGEPDDPSDRPWRSWPTDAYAARGHSGQYVVVVPSAKLVVVRLGLSLPDDGIDGTEELVAAVIREVAGWNERALAEGVGSSLSRAID